MRKESRSAGFTMIELLFTLAIIGILAGIIVPSFLAARRSANDVAAKGYLKEAISYQEINQTESNVYTNKSTLLTLGLSTPPDDVTLDVLSATSNTYCMKSVHSAGTGRTFFATPNSGLTESPCT